MNDEKRIRKLYGEKMWHLCRTLFPTLLDTPGLVSQLLEEHFNPSRFLYDDIIDNHVEERFKNYIYSFNDVENNNQIITNKSVRDLLSEAGYNFYECHTEKEVQAFKKYYASGEELCTFRGGRLNRCYIFFAVKKDVENIRRENFSNPKREDEYGTSVISIQFTKGDRNTLSIKNRYNHTVNNPDATFNNNLENIIPGLTNAFEKDYNLKINQNEEQSFDIPGYVKAYDGQWRWYKYNYEIDNIYYCPDNIIIYNFEVIKDYQKKEKYLIFDYFILDLVNKEIRLFDNTINDGFIDCNKDIEKIDIKNIESGKEINLTFKDGKCANIIVDNSNKLISYSNNDTEIVKNQFLHYNKSLIKIDLPGVIAIGDYFLENNQTLTQIDLPNVKKIGNGFLYCDGALGRINLPNVETIGDYFLIENQILSQIDLPSVIVIGDYFLENNQTLTQINLPNIEIIGDNFLNFNISIKKLLMPNVEIIGDLFLNHNINHILLNLPNLKLIKKSSYYKIKALSKIKSNLLRKILNSYLQQNIYKFNDDTVSIKNKKKL